MRIEDYFQRVFTGWLWRDLSAGGKEDDSANYFGAVGRQCACHAISKSMPRNIAALT